jgi:hypothetical protein
MDYYFITDNPEIEEALLQMGMKKFISGRKNLYNHIKIRQEDICNGVDVIGRLLDDLLDPKKTTIFIHGGYEIL